MLIEINKDVTTVPRGVIAHGVNCQGVMGSGVAKALRNKWPVVFDTYSKLPTGYESLGTLQIVNVDKENDIHVANCFTQVTYGRTGRHADVGAIRTTIDQLCEWAWYRIESGIETPIYMPQIGCGLGGLSWEKEVRPILQELTDKWMYPNIYVCTL